MLEPIVCLRSTASWLQSYEKIPLLLFFFIFFTHKRAIIVFYSAHHGSPHVPQQNGKLQVCNIGVHRVYRCLTIANENWKQYYMFTVLFRFRMYGNDHRLHRFHGIWCSHSFVRQDFNGIFSRARAPAHPAFFRFFPRNYTKPVQHANYQWFNLV